MENNMDMDKSETFGVEKRWPWQKSSPLENFCGRSMFPRGVNEKRKCGFSIWETLHVLDAPNFCRRPMFPPGVNEKNKMWVLEMREVVCTWRLKGCLHVSFKIFYNLILVIIFCLYTQEKWGHFIVAELTAERVHIHITKIPTDNYNLPLYIHIIYVYINYIYVYIE